MLPCIPLDNSYSATPAEFTVTVAPLPAAPATAILTTDVVTLSATVASGVELVSYAID